MGKGKRRHSTPTKRSGALKRAEKRIDDAIYELVYFGDILLQTRKELLETNRLKRNSPKHAMLDVRLDMLNYVIANCMKISREEVDVVREARSEDEFKQKVEDWKDKLCPVIILVGH